MDASSIIIVRTSFSRKDQELVYQGMHALAEAKRLFFPNEVIKELERYAGKENPALQWVRSCDSKALSVDCDFTRVKSILALVPEILDSDKEGTEEADPYILTVAQTLKEAGKDVRVVTEEFKTTIGPRCRWAGPLAIWEFQAYRFE